MESFSYIQSPANLHGPVPIGIRHTLDLQQGAGQRYLERVRLILGSRNGPYFLFSANHADSKFGFEQAIQRATVTRQRVGGKTAKHSARQPDVVQYGGNLVK